MKNTIVSGSLEIFLVIGALSILGTGSASTLIKGQIDGRAPLDTKIAPLIMEAISGVRTDLVAPQGTAAFGALPPEHPLLRTDEKGQLEVYVQVSDQFDNLHREELEGYGLQVVHLEEDLGLIQGWVPPERVKTIGELAYVTRIAPPAYTYPQTGSVTTEGDAILGGEALRSLGYDGNDVRVGVISLGVDNIAVAQATGDLPAVQILSAVPGLGDEGTALLEIVHDIAPAAALGFCDAPTTLAFLQCIRDLKVIFGADILVDDLKSFGAPYFEDGPVARSVTQAVAEGILYVSSAGNTAKMHYEGQYHRTATSDYALHDFGAAAGGATDLGMDLKIAPGATVLVFLQWNDPFGGSGNDYDLGLFDDAGVPVAISAGFQDGDDDPIEAVGIFNDSIASLSVEVIVEKYRGHDRRLEMYLWSDYARDVQVEQYQVPAGSIFGHSAVPGVLAVGAVNAADPGNDTIEPFSSRGPAEIFFPNHEIRDKPDLVAVDGVSVSGAGGFPSPFYGTSAAAPHVAGLAALLMSARPDATGAQTGTALQSAAIDLGQPGFDFTFGAGRVDGFAAEAELATPDITANESDGPLTVSSKNGVSIRVALDASTQPTPLADWWLVAETPSGDWYYFIYQNQWVNAGSNLGNLGSAYRGPLFNLPAFEVLNIHGLPVGRYGFYFGVDTQPNDILDRPLYYDSVIVNVTK